MAIQNQGYRQDLNLAETIDEKQAIDSLAGAGTAVDLSYLQNNLRNTSSIPYNNVKSGFFSYEIDREVSVSQIIAEGTNSKTKITVSLTDPYLFKFGDLVEIKDIPSESSDSVLNQQYAVISTSTDFKTVFAERIGLNYSNSNVPVTNLSFSLVSSNIFTFTDGDVINVSEDVTISDGTTSTELNKNKDYYIVESNGINKFKLSENSGGSAILISNNANTTATPNNFNFIRKDPVNQQQLLNFIEPEIQDDEHFNWLGGSSINGAFDETQINMENSEFFMTKKYRGDKSITTNESLRFEGNISLNDPADYNNTSSRVLNQGVDGAPAPGIYIGGVRAFSSDNNPWERIGSADGTGKLKTESEEVSIGQLTFSDGGTDGAMQITGIEDDVEISASGLTANSFTHKMSVEVQDENGNKESYFLLLSEN